MNPGFRIRSKTQWLMFLLASGHHVRLVPFRLSLIWKIAVTLNRGEDFWILTSFNIPDSELNLSNGFGFLIYLQSILYK